MHSLRPRAQDDTSQDGFTLIELLICMVVFSIAMSIVTKAVTNRAEVHDGRAGQRGRQR